MSKDRHDIPDLDAVAEAYARTTGFEQPPAELDRMIRRAAAERARDVTRRARTRAWTVGFAVAATLALAVTSLLRIERIEPDGGAIVSSGQPAPSGVAVEQGGGASAKIMFDTNAPAERANECASVANVPDRWLACIATLARAGRSADAARELDAFRTQYPNHAVPADLASAAHR